MAFVAAAIALPEGIRGDERGFYIVSEMNGKVLDIHKADPKPGAHVVTYKKKETRDMNQLWYLDPRDGVIRSKLNHYAMEANENKDKIHMKPYTGDARQQWVIDGQKIINKVFRNECLDIKRANKRDDADIIAYPYEGKPNQHWRMEYL